MRLREISQVKEQVRYKCREREKEKEKKFRFIIKRVLIENKSGIEREREKERAVEEGQRWMQEEDRGRKERE